MGIKKKTNGAFVRVVEKEVTADDVLAEIQAVKRKIESNKSQAEFLNNQLAEWETELAELTEIYKQII